MERFFRQLNRWSFAMLCAVRAHKLRWNDYKLRQLTLMHNDWALTLQLVGERENLLRDQFNQSQDMAEKEAINRELSSLQRIRHSFSKSIELL
jgi:hypothetical protein